MKAGLWEASERDAQDRCEKARKELADTLALLDEATSKVDYERHVLSDIEKKANDSTHYFSSVIEKINGANQDYDRYMKLADAIRNEIVSLEQKAALYSATLKGKEEHYCMLVSNIEMLEKSREELASKNVAAIMHLQRQNSDISEKNMKADLREKELSERESLVVLREAEVQNYILDFEKQTKALDLREKRLNSLREELSAKH